MKYLYGLSEDGGKTFHADTGFHTASPALVAKWNDGREKLEFPNRWTQLCTLSEALAAGKMREAGEALTAAFDGDTECTEILDMVGAKDSALRVALNAARGEQ